MVILNISWGKRCCDFFGRTERMHFPLSVLFHFFCRVNVRGHFLGTFQGYPKTQSLCGANAKLWDTSVSIILNFILSFPSLGPIGGLHPSNKASYIIFSGPDAKTCNTRSTGTASTFVSNRFPRTCQLLQRHEQQAIAKRCRRKSKYSTYQTAES